MEAKYPRRESNSGPFVSETSALSSELRGLIILSGYTDSNRGPFAPKANALPSCATPRFASLRPTRAWCRQKELNPLTRENGFTVRRASPLRRAGLVVPEGFEPPTTLGVSQVLFQLSYETETVLCAPLAPVAGLEPATSCVTGKRALLLLYTGIRGGLPRGRPGWS